MASLVITSTQQHLNEIQSNYWWKHIVPDADQKCYAFALGMKTSEVDFLAGYSFDV